MCNRCDRKAVEHLIMEYYSYERERLEMMRVILDEKGGDDSVMYERPGVEWIAMIVGSVSRGDCCRVRECKAII
jgi:hypothetical protein